MMSSAPRSASTFSALQMSSSRVINSSSVILRNGNLCTREMIVCGTLLSSVVANAGEQISVMDAARLDGVLQRADRGFLADDVAEALGTIFTGECLVGHLCGGEYRRNKKPARKSPGRTVSRRWSTLSLLPSG